MISFDSVNELLVSLSIGLQFELVTSRGDPQFKGSGPFPRTRSDPLGPAEPGGNGRPSGRELHLSAAHSTRVHIWRLAYANSCEFVNEL